VEEEVFYISDSPKVTYTEIGVLPFIEELGTGTRDLFFNVNKSLLYILRDGTYKDMKFILAHIGKYGLHLTKGGDQKAHLCSPLDFILASYLMAMSGIQYPDIVAQNMFYCLPKDKYLPYYHKKT
jgi:hypothetical protein